MRLLCSTALVALLSSSAATQSATPYAIADAVGMRRFTPMSAIQLSPDGKLVAYSLVDVFSRSFSTKEEMRTDRGVPQVVSGSELFVSDIRSGRARRIAGGKGTSAWGASWSPDGRALAYFSDEDGKPSLWIWSRISGRNRRLTRAQMRPGILDAPRWTPDGKRVIVKAAARSTSRELPASDTGRRAITPNPPRIERFTSGLDTADQSADTRARSRVVAEWMISNLAIVEVETGRIRLLARDEPIINYWIAPHGRSVAFSRARTDLRLSANVNAFDLVVASIDSGTVRVVAPGIAHAFGAMASWSPDGRRLAFFSAPGEAAESPGILVRGVYTVRENGDSLRSIGLTKPTVASIFDVPLWDEQGRTLYAVADGQLCQLPADGSGERRLDAPLGREVMGAASRAQSGRLWLPDGKHAFVVTRDTTTLRQALARVPLDGGRPEIISEDEQMLLGSAATNPDVFRLDASGGQLAIVRETAAEPPDLWLYDATGGNRRRLTRTNPGHAAYRFGASRLVTWLSDDGVPLRGAVFLPPDYTPAKRYPLVVCVYGGGRLSRSVFSFGGFLPSMHHAQLFTTRGFVVFYPDAPQQFGTPLLDLAKTVLPGASRLIEMGVADADRLAIMGHSYGGYSVYSIITQSTRFRAAVVSAGASNLTSAYGIMIGSAGLETFFEGGQGKIGASLWAARDRYIENSPIFRFDRIRTPVLIIHGARDRSVPVWMADEAFVALRRLRREVEYVRYLDEEHSEWTGPASADMHQRVIDFLTARLMPKSTELSNGGGDTRP